MAEVIRLRPEPGTDTRVSKDPNDVTLLTAIRAYREEAFEARKTRMARNRENRRAYLGIQDWSHKQSGQSQEFLPKTSIAVEQFTQFIKKALTRFGDFFDVELSLGSQSPLSGSSIRKLINCHIDECLIEDGKSGSLAGQISEGVKVGSLESLMIFKIHGNMVSSPVYESSPDGQSAKRVDKKYWKLRIDLIRPEDYLPDPTGNGLYEIHSCERDFSYVLKRAREGIYDLDVVNKIKEDFMKSEEEDEKRKELDKAQDRTTKPQFRRKIVVDEFWGTILDKDGEIVHENCFMAVANDKYIIRKPEPNPFWHGKSPFEAIPLIRVPFSEWHKALFDDAVQINFALNEMYNLIIDGGISSVWGIKQLRAGDLEDPRQVTDGIPQGTTLVVKDSLPHNAKVLETVSEGTVPPDAMAIFEMLSREFASGALSNELKLGSFPQKDVLATEVLELSQSQAVTIDGIVIDVEKAIESILHKIWLTILQNMDSVPSQKVVETVGSRAAMILARMTPVQRFSILGSMYGIKVYGLSEVMSKARDFQKLMALLQAVSQLPMLAQAFFTKYSPNKIIASLMKMLGVNPEQLARNEREDKLTTEEIAGALQFAELAPRSGGTTQRNSPVNAENTGSDQLPSEIASAGNPTAGLAGAGNT